MSEEVYEEEFDGNYPPGPRHPMARRFRGYLPVVVDVETGGFNAATDALLEIAAVLIDMRPDGELVLGFHRRGRWDEVVDINPCMLATPAGNQAREAVRAWAVECGIAPYNQRTNEGLLRHVVVREQAPWLRTGDIGRIDETGFLYIVDRKKDMIISGGQNVYPTDIESVILDHPAVAEAAVIGIPHADLGEVPKAVCELRDGATASACELHAFLDERLAPYKVPAHFEFVASLPRNAMGKVLKRELSREPTTPNNQKRQRPF